MTTVFLKIFDFYQKLLELAPEGWRTFAACAVLIILAVAIWRFVRKNIIWVVIVILLLPGTWPALKQIWHSIGGSVSKFFGG